MESQRRYRENICALDDLDRQADLAVRDLSSWHHQSLRRQFSFNFCENSSAQESHQFVTDIQQIVNLFDRAGDTSDLRDLSNAFSYSFPVSESSTSNDEVTPTNDGISTEQTIWKGKSDYFKVKNPSELFRLNQNFSEELKKGFNHFGICAVNNTRDRVATCWGIASAMNFMINRHVAIICEDIHSDYFTLAGDVENKVLSIPRYGMEIPYIQKAGISLYSIYDFVDVIYNLSPSVVQHFFNDFASLVGIVLWDIPMINEVDAKRHLYIPAFESLSSISIVANKSEDIRQLSKISSYFERYGVRLLGLIFGKKELDV